MMNEIFNHNPSLPEYVGRTVLDTIGLVIPSIDATLRDEMKLPDNIRALGVISSRTGAAGQICAVDEAVKNTNASLVSVELPRDTKGWGGHGNYIVVGGLMTWAFLKLGNGTSYLEIGGTIATVYGDLPVWKFAVFALLSALLTWVLGKIFRRKRSIRTCLLRVRFGREERVLAALVDSGNLLEDPVSGTPVIFLKGKAAKLLPKGLLAAMKNGADSLMLPEAGRLRVIPGKTVSGSGLLLAAVPDGISLRAGREWEERRALVAVDFTGGDYGGFEALVPEALFY